MANAFTVSSGIFGADQPSGPAATFDEQLASSNYNGLFESLWANLQSGLAGGNLRREMEISPLYQRLDEATKSTFDAIITALDPASTSQQRIDVLQSISGNGEACVPQAERFFAKMFGSDEFNLNGTLDDGERTSIRAIETALNGMGLRDSLGQAIDIKVDGVADDRLAALLRNPEIVERLIQAAPSGVTFDPKFVADFNQDHGIVRTLNTRRREPETSQSL